MAPESLLSGSQDYLVVTDVVEFFTREESPSGVQRVVLETAPFLIQAGFVPLILDRTRGKLVPLSPAEASALFVESLSVDARARHACSALVRARSAPEVAAFTDSVLLCPGAIWISDALMMALRDAVARGARLVAYLYDLTPVLEAGHTAAVNSLFERYLTLLADCAVRVPAISRSSRNDFEKWCVEHDRVAPAGQATRLPTALNPADFDVTESPWPRPYVLFVGTVESRKNHIVALRAWQQLIAELGAEFVPDLVCIGRLGWHAEEFLREFTFSQGLSGKVSVLSGNVSDEELARFYAHAFGSIYPSRYEGWGLPVSESITFGVPVIAAENSSLTEAGGDAAIYVPTGDAAALAQAVAANFLDPERREAQRSNLESRAPRNPTWAEVADMLIAEVENARTSQPRSEHGWDMIPNVELGREYMLSPMPNAPDGAHADKYVEWLTTEGTTPLLHQPRDPHDFSVTDAALIGSFGAPQTWGLELRPGISATLRINRPVDGDLVALFSTRSMPGRVRVSVSGPGGQRNEEVYLGSVLTVPLGVGQQGESAQAIITVADASDSVEGFLGLVSFAVLSASDEKTQVVAAQAAAKALRQELDFMAATRSWKLTAPLRRWKGRGSA